METKGMDAREAAKYLGCSEAAVRLWQRQGRLKFYKLGRLVRFTKVDLDAWMESNLGKGRGSDEGHSSASAPVQLQTSATPAIIADGGPNGNE